MKLISWNIDSLNAALTSNSNRAKMTQSVLSALAMMEADIIALQETKLPATGPSQKHLNSLKHYFPDYEHTWRSSVEPARKGYAGTMFLYKKTLVPSISFPDISAPSTMDQEGRIITLEMANCFITTVYTPNAGDGLKRLNDRVIWDAQYANYLAELDSKKPVIACGDYNVAHKEIDLANPQANQTSPGFTKEERIGFTNILNKGFTDTFRLIHGDIPHAYSWWAQRSRTSKLNNTGWRIDYWLVSNRIAHYVSRSDMIDSGDRQDHTPLLLEIEI